MLFFGAASMLESIPGTRISVEVPHGYKVATKFPGLIHEAKASTLILNEIPKPVDEVRQTLEKHAIEARRMTFDRREKLEISGREAILVYATQKVADRMVRERLAVFGDDRSSVMVVASVPIEFDLREGPKLEAAIRSLVWNRKGKVDPYAGLPFRLAEIDGLQVIKRQPLLVVIARQAYRHAVPPEEPLLIVGASEDRIQLDDPKAFAHARIARMQKVEDVTILSEGPRKFGGMDGYEILALGRDRETQVKLTIYQVIAQDESHYFSMRGTVGYNDRERYLSKFMLAADRFQRSHE